MDRLGTLTIVVAAAILAGALFVPPVIGLANNGDYGKVSLHYALFSPNEEEFYFAPQTHTFLPEKQWDSGFFTSTHLPVQAALFLHRLSGQTDFDCRFLATVYSALFLLALGILQPCLTDLSPLRRCLFSATLLLLLGDIAYIALFNTFFMDATALTGFLLAAAAWLRYQRSQKLGWLLLFTAAALLAILSKAQHLLTALPLAALAAHKLRPARLVAVAVILSSCVYGLRQIQEDYAPITIFNVVFYAILPLSDDKPKHLAELGFDESYAKWIGRNAYDSGTRIGAPEVYRELLRRSSQGKIASFLATHPAITFQILIKRLNEAAFVRPLNFGNYDRSAGRPPLARSNAMSLASSAKSWLFLGRPFLLLAYAFFLGGLALRQPASIALTTSVFLAFAVGAFGDSLDVTRHLTLFNLLLDLLLLTTLYTSLNNHRLKAVGFSCD